MSGGGTELEVLSSSMPDMTRESVYGSPNLDNMNEGASTLVGEPSVTQEQKSIGADRSRSSSSPRTIKYRNFSKSSETHGKSKSPGRRSLSGSTR